MTTPQAPEPQKLGDGRYKQFLMRQVARILARGGSNQDVSRWLQHVEGVPLRDVFEAQAMSTEGATPTPGLLAGLSMSAWQGLSFGFGDEALGGLVGLATLATTGNPIAAKQRQEQTTQGFRDQMGAFRRENPAAAIAGQVVGGLALPVAATKGMGGMGTAGKVATAVGAGAAGGALTAAGETEGGMGPRSRAALVGGLIGAPLGALGAGAAAAGTAGLKRVIGSKLVQSGVAAAKSWSQRIQMDATTTAQQRARELLADALQEGGTPINVLVQRARQAQAAGQPVGLADIADEPVLALGQSAQALRGESKRQLTEALAARTSATGDRMLGQMFTSFRMGLKNAQDAAEELVAQRAATSAPLYQQAHQLEVRVTPTIARLLKEREFRDAWLIGQRAARLEDEVAGTGIGLPIPDLPEDPATLLTVPIRALDYMKQSLDDVIDAGAQPGQPILGRRSAMALRSALNDALDEVDHQAPVYAAARAAFRGRSEMLEALALGRGGIPNRYWPSVLDAKTERFTQRHSTTVERDLADLKSADEQAMYRLGAMQDIADAIHAPSANQAKVPMTIFGGRAHKGTAETEAERRIRALFGKDLGAAEDFMDIVHNEARLAERTRLLSSEGAPVGSAAEELSGMSQTKTIRTSPMGTVRQLAARATAKSRQTYAEEVSDEVSALLTRGLRDPQDLISLLQWLEPTLKRLNLPTRRAAVAGTVTGATASMEREQR